MIIVIAANRASAKVTVMKEPTNNTSKSENEREESTYALLIRSEEKRRNLIEMTLYSFLILGGGDRDLAVRATTSRHSDSWIERSSLRCLRRPV
jgi:hypothetical protein